MMIDTKSLNTETKALMVTALLADLYPTFYDDWRWLNAHPAFRTRAAQETPEPNGNTHPYSMFSRCLDIMVAKVDPSTGRVEDKWAEETWEGRTRKVKVPDPARNTLTEIWLECGRVEAAEDLPGLGPSFFSEETIRDGVLTHDYNLDCGGTSFHEAIVKLAALVKKHYGDYAEGEAVDW